MTFATDFARAEHTIQLADGATLARFLHVIGADPVPGDEDGVLFEADSMLVTVVKWDLRNRRVTLAFDYDVKAYDPPATWIADGGIARVVED